MAITILVVAFLLVVTTFFFVQRAGGFRFPWIQFYIRGKESGFRFGEINLLRRAAVDNSLRNPTSLFWSVKTLDRCIRSAIVRFRAAGSEDEPRNMEFLSKLFDFRRRVEFDQPKYRLGLTSTRGADPGQTFKITLEGGGVYISKLIENNRRYMAITYPRGNPLPAGFSWRNQDIKAYFWRPEDAGYYFESKVVGDYLDRKVPILHIAHADGLVRAQKRRSVRREVGSPAHLFPLRALADANESIETRGGYRCKLVDISEDGAALVVGGRAKAGLPIKIQAEVEDETVVLCGIIKSANFKQKNRASVLHIQAERPSRAMRVKILSYVYQLFDAGETRTELEGAHPASSAKSNSQQASTPRQRAAAAASGQERKRD